MCLVTENVIYEKSKTLHFMPMQPPRCHKEMHCAINSVSKHVLSASTSRLHFCITDTFDGIATFFVRRRCRFGRSIFKIVIPIWNHLYTCAFHISLFAYILSVDGLPLSVTSDC